MDLAGRLDRLEGLKLEGVITHEDTSASTGETGRVWKRRDGRWERPWSAWPRRSVEGDSRPGWSGWIHTGIDLHARRFRESPKQGPAPTFSMTPTRSRWERSPPPVRAHRGGPGGKHPETRRGDHRRGKQITELRRSVIGRRIRKGAQQDGAYADIRFPRANEEHVFSKGPA